MRIFENQSISIRRPDDWHVHFRDGEMLETVVPYTAAQFSRAIVMPNLENPVTSTSLAKAYQKRIVAAIPADIRFQPLMTCYLTDKIDIVDLSAGFHDGVFTAAKLYPANATTNSTFGVSNVSCITGALECMQELGMPLLVHGEVADTDVDIFDREAVFIERVMSQIVRDFPELKIVFEHVTTKDAVDFVNDRHSKMPGYMGATITAHHLVINRTDLFHGGVRPHLYCLPIAKREHHRLALRNAAMSGIGPFFLGTDSAPHAIISKENDCGCAGVFSAPVAMQVYAQAFNEDGKIDALEAFASLNGPAFYGFPVNKDTLTLERADSGKINEVKTAFGTEIKVFVYGDRLDWRVTSI